jgi:hypothetical protein
MTGGRRRMNEGENMIDMVFLCENCGSLFVVNHFDPKVQNGDYEISPHASCPLCNTNLKKNSLYDASKEDTVFFEETGKKIMKLIGEEDGKRFFKLIVEQIAFFYNEAWGYE